MIIPIDMRVEATTRSTMINGIKITIPMIKAFFDLRKHKSRNEDVRVNIIQLTNIICFLTRQGKQKDQSQKRHLFQFVES